MSNSAISLALGNQLRDFQGATQDFRQAVRLYRQWNNEYLLQQAIEQLRQMRATE